MKKPNIPSNNFDPEDAAQLQATASTKLLQMLKAKRDAKKSLSTREFAVRCVRGLEATIHQLFDEGASTQEVLSQLIDSLPAIPMTDLQYALRAIGGRNKKMRTTSQIQKQTQEKTDLPDKQLHHQETKQKSSINPSITTHAIPDLPVWADGSDKRADESDEDYRFRKEIEGPPEARNKFIGEQKIDLLKGK